MIEITAFKGPNPANIIKANGQRKGCLYWDENNKNVVDGHHPKVVKQIQKDQAYEERGKRGKASRGGNKSGGWTPLNQA